MTLTHTKFVDGGGLEDVVDDALHDLARSTNYWRARLFARVDTVAAVATAQFQIRFAWTCVSTSQSLLAVLQKLASIRELVHRTANVAQGYPQASGMH